MAKLRVYLDTSVLGGYFDAEFSSASKRFFEALFAGVATPLISNVLIGEVKRAPVHVRELLDKVLALEVERLGFPQEAKILHNAYMQAGVVNGKWADDALHVANAVAARADVIVSWNFKHIVNPRRIKAFNGVNISNGFGPVVIMTPANVASYLETGE